MMAPPNQFRHASQITQPAAYRDGRWQTFTPQPPVTRTLRGRSWKLRPGLTFTPYANPTLCNARCAFCSEELLRRDATRLTAHSPITDHDRYFAALDRAWGELSGFPMGLSLSGLEATSDPAWLRRLLALVRQHGDLFPERVLYTNGTGLVTHPDLIDHLNETGFTRAELSRCHFDEEVNQRIMRFRRTEPVRRADAFEQLIGALRGRVPVKLSCILSTPGTSTITDVEAYIDRAHALGVEQIVFRELSALGDAYQPSRTHRWVDENRAPIRPLMDTVMPDAGRLRPGWRFSGSTSGYYYYNEVYERRGVRIILEASSYTAHHDAVRSGVLQKLVFHSTGDLCGDWVPSSLVIGNYH